ncbi:MAG: c-type cytochrome [Acidimicrobiia bacterium]|nr:c-type cytochrome [Acidimicrobiia bacterium]
MSDHPGDAEFTASTDRWMLVGLVLMGLFVLAFPLYRVYEPAARTAARVEQMESQAASGADIYDFNCSSCHGSEGRGGTAPALAAEQFLGMVSDDQIVQFVSLGTPGSEMVGYSIDNGGPLTSQQIRAVAVYLRSFEEVAVDNPSWRYPLAAEGLSGRDMYVLGCSRCHGVQLGGGEEIPALGVGSDAADDSDARIAKRIREGEDEMPAFGGTLGDGQIQMLVEYLREAQAESP